MFTHFTWLKFALWNVLQNTGRPLRLHDWYQLSMLLGEKKKEVPRVTSWKMVDCLSLSSILPVSLLLYWISNTHSKMCTLGYSSHVPKWHGKKRPTFSQVSVPISTNFSGPSVRGCQQISIPVCGLSWCHMTFPVFPTCKLHRTWVWSESAAMERSRKNFHCFSSFPRVSMHYIWCTEEGCGSGHVLACEHVVNAKWLSFLPGCVFPWLS